MANEGYKKRDLGRVRQPVELGTSVSSNDMSSAADNHRIEIGMSAEKMTLVTTGNLVVDVQAQIGVANAHGVVAATTTPSTTVTTNMFSAVEVSYTSGSGKLLILAK